MINAMLGNSSTQSSINMYSISGIYNGYKNSNANAQATNNFYQSGYVGNNANIHNMNFVKNVSTSMSQLYSSSVGNITMQNKNNVSEEELAKQAEAYVKSYNEAVDALGQRSGQNKTIKRLETKLEAAIERSKTELEEIGITKDDKGKLVIDQKLFSESLEKDFDKVKNTLGDVAKETQEVAKQVMSVKTHDLLENNSNGIQSYMTKEQYNKAMLKMTGNRQFMSFYTGAETMINMFI
ncbi:MAG: hypothetical protein ACRCSG_04015 [Cellulosilyticaceae bacterium]